MIHMHPRWSRVGTVGLTRIRRMVSLLFITFLPKLLTMFAH